MQKKFYVSFSNDGGQFFKGGHSIVMAEDMSEAREKTFNAYGGKFFTTYSSETWENRDGHGFNDKLNEIIE
jgi:cysteine synthase